MTYLATAQAFTAGLGAGVHTPRDMTDQLTYQGPAMPSPVVLDSSPTTGGWADYLIAANVTHFGVSYGWCGDHTAANNEAPRNVSSPSVTDTRWLSLKKFVKMMNGKGLRGFVRFSENSDSTDAGSTTFQNWVTAAAKDWANDTGIDKTMNIVCPNGECIYDTNTIWNPINLANHLLMRAQLPQSTGQIIGFGHAYWNSCQNLDGSKDGSNVACALAKLANGTTDDLVVYVCDGYPSSSSINGDCTGFASDMAAWSKSNGNRPTVAWETGNWLGNTSYDTVPNNPSAWAADYASILSPLKGFAPCLWDIHNNDGWFNMSNAGGGSNDAALPKANYTALTKAALAIKPASTGVSPTPYPDMTGWTSDPTQGGFSDTFAGPSLSNAWFTYGTVKSGSYGFTWRDSDNLVNNGLTLRCEKDSNGNWFVGDAQVTGTAQSSFAAKQYGWTTFRVSMVATIPKGNGVGCYLLMWPSDNNWNNGPEIDLVETPDGSKQTIAVSWHYVTGSVTDTFTVDATKKTRYTMEFNPTTGFRFFINDVEKTLSAAWNANKSAMRAMVPGVSGYVGIPPGNWGGGYSQPDANTPNPADTLITSVEVYVPAAGTPPPVTPSLVIGPPHDPGTLSTGGLTSATWDTTGTVNVAAAWVVIGGPPNYSYRGNPVPLSANPGVAQAIHATFPTTGDMLKLYSTGTVDGSGNPFQDLSGTVTLNTGSTPTPPPTGTVVTVLQGQSNAELLMSGTAPYPFYAIYQPLVQALTGVATHQALAQRYDFPDPSGGYTIYPGEATYTTEGDSSGLWLNPAGTGATLTQPATWVPGVNGVALQKYLGYYINPASKAPVIFIRHHSEYDSKMDSGDYQYYAAAENRFNTLIRTWAGLSAARMPIFFSAPAFWSGNNAGACNTIRGAWVADVTASGQCRWGSLANYDETDIGDASHANQAGQQQTAGRLAISVSKWLYDNGYSVNTLDWLPKQGPRPLSIARVSGNTSQLDVKVQHDKGTDLVAPSGTPSLSAWSPVDSTGTLTVTAQARLDATHIRLTLNRALTGTDAQIVLDYCVLNGFYGAGSLFTDNWHTLTLPVYATSAFATYAPGLRLALCKPDKPLVIGTDITLSDAPDGTTIIGGGGLKLPVRGLLSAGPQPFIHGNGATASVNTLSDVTTRPGLLDGYIINVQWWELEASANVYTTTIIDTALANLRTYNAAHPSKPLTAMLKVWTGCNAPAWAKALNNGPINNNVGGTAVTIGKFWRPAYISAFNNLIAHLGAVYDSEPLIRAVFVTTTAVITDEPFHVVGRAGLGTGTDLGNIYADGTYSDAVQQQNILDMVGPYVAAFPTTLIHVVVNPFEHTDGGTYVADPLFSKGAMDYWRDNFGSSVVFGNNSMINPLDLTQAPIYPLIQAEGGPITYNCGDNSVATSDWAGAIANALLWGGTASSIPVDAFGWLHQTASVYDRSDAQITGWSTALSTAAITPLPTGTATVVPPLARGIFAVHGAVPVPPAIYTNANVDGIALSQNWATIEPTDGGYFWDNIDAALASCIANGKQLTIEIDGGVACPPWLLAPALGVGTISFPWYLATFGPPLGTITQCPLPWDPIFLDRFTAMIQALGARYANNTAVTAIKLTGINVVTGETLLPYDKVVGTTTYLPTTDWQAAGYGPTKLRTAFKVIAAAWLAAFPNTPIFPYIANWGFPAIDDNGNLVPNSPNGDQTLMGLMMTDWLTMGGTQAWLASATTAPGYIYPRQKWQPASTPVVAQSGKVINDATSMQSMITLCNNFPTALLELFQTDILNTTEQSALASYVGQTAPILSIKVPSTLVGDATGHNAPMTAKLTGPPGQLVSIIAVSGAAGNAFYVPLNGTGPFDTLTIPEAGSILYSRRITNTGDFLKWGVAASGAYTDTPALPTGFVINAAASRPINAAITATSQVTGSLVRKRPLRAQLVSTSQLTGVLARSRREAGSIVSSSSITAALGATRASVPHALSGAIQATSAVGGALSGKHVLHSSIIATSAVTGTLNRRPASSNTRPRLTFVG